MLQFPDFLRHIFPEKNWNVENYNLTIEYAIFGASKARTTLMHRILLWLT